MESEIEARKPPKANRKASTASNSNIVVSVTAMRKSVLNGVKSFDSSAGVNAQESSVKSTKEIHMRKPADSRAYEKRPSKKLFPCKKSNTGKLQKDNSKSITVPLNTKKLSLEVLKGEGIPIGSIIQISTKGLAGSKRDVQDGFAYFGTETCNVSGAQL
eukprot:TRINITY_DN7313_c0_g3_i3.p1 TRINITY_DN7313_c0_g3~~TRINITY_DN7313_c0_g3_i3.p1  ORF type:complete len:159 (-),score=20.59 TRINITY_DN7313_c0_g3_i3:719-1195(-)